QEAAVAFQQSVLGAWHDVDRALARYAAEQQRRIQLARIETVRHDELGLAQARQTGGMTDYLAVLDARSAQLQAQGARADSEAQLLLDLVAVYKSVGV
ncbi:MAG: RND transporter, partial [Microvirgula sp.]